jgi:ATP-binding cassette subfamily F protein uup
LLLVSHDREFLNNVVTSTLVLEGEGRVKEYAGGYDDWLRQRQLEPAAERIEPSQQPAKSGGTGASRRAPSAARRLTYAEQRELEALPERIGAIEAQVGELHEAMSDPAFYRQDPAAIVSANTRLQALEKDLADAYGRWEVLETLSAQGK